MFIVYIYMYMYIRTTTAAKLREMLLPHEYFTSELKREAFNQRERIEERPDFKENCSIPRDL